MAEENGTAVAHGDAAANDQQPPVKKARVEDCVEERDFDEETQKALEEIDTIQNEIDSLNERKFSVCQSVAIVVLMISFSLYRGQRRDLESRTEVQQIEEAVV